MAKYHLRGVCSPFRCLQTMPVLHGHVLTPFRLYAPSEYKKQANLIANNGQERKDLYTDNW